MPLDPNIPLQVQPAQMPAGLSFDNMLNTGNHLMELRQNMQQLQSQNALRGILSQPGALDPATGMPTQDAMRQVAGVDPNVAMQLQHNALVDQQNRLQMGVYKTEAFQKKLGLLNDSYAPVYKVYTDALKAGAPPDQAKAMAQTELEAVNKTLDSSGAFSDEEKRNHPTQFDPAQMQRFFIGSDQMLLREKYAYEAAKDKRAEAHETALEQHYQHEDAKTDRAGWTVMTDPNKKDEAGNQIQYRYNPGSGEATTLDGSQPYTPAGAQKLGGPATAMPEVSPEERESAGAQASTGMPLNMISPGYGAQAAARRTQIRNDAIKRIMDETGKNAAEAGVELANRSIEYTSGKRSSGELTSMLGFTKQAVNQLEYNVDQASEEMKKIPSSDISPIINAIVRGEEKWTGDPRYARLFFYMNAAATESARVLAGAQASKAQLQEGARAEAQKWANINMTPKSWLGEGPGKPGVSQAILDEGRNRIQNYQTALQGQRLGGGTTGADAAPPPTSGGGQSGAKQPAAKTDEATQDNFYRGDKPPAKFPDAKPGRDHRWYVQSGGKFFAVTSDAAGAAQPAAQPTQAAPAKAAPAKAEPAQAAPAKANATGRTRQDPVPVTTLDEAMKLPPGTFFVGPDKKIRQRPQAATVATN